MQAKKVELERFPLLVGDIPREDYERSEVDSLPGLLQGCEVFLDVGANLGLYTFYANQILENATIYAIEADPQNYERLRGLCEEWSANSSNRIVPVHAIVSDRNGKQVFLTSREKTVGGVFSTPAMEAFPREGQVEVDCVTLNEFYEDGRPTVVKIDIEGGEYRALLGARRFLESDHTAFFMEIHWWGDVELKKRPSDVGRIFFRRGFSARLIGNHWYLRKRGSLRCWISALVHGPRFALQLQGRKYVLRKLKALAGSSPGA